MFLVSVNVTVSQSFGDYPLSGIRTFLAGVKMTGDRHFLQSEQDGYEVPIAVS
jgi:hypothetical protein